MHDLFLLFTILCAAETGLTQQGERQGAAEEGMLTLLSLTIIQAFLWNSPFRMEMAVLFIKLK
jgi:hypothetical protein